MFQKTHVLCVRMNRKKACAERSDDLKKKKSAGVQSFPGDLVT